MDRIPLTIAVDHPAFSGHFPGTPIVPGVVLLDEAVHAIGLVENISLACCQISTAKFHSTVRPGESLAVDHQKLANGSLRFTIRSGERMVATGSLIIAAPITASRST